MDKIPIFSIPEQTSPEPYQATKATRRTCVPRTAAKRKHGRPASAEAEDGVTLVLPPRPRRRLGAARRAPALLSPPRSLALCRAPSVRAPLVRGSAVPGPRGGVRVARRGRAEAPKRGGDVVVDAAAGARAEVGGGVAGHPHAGAVQHPTPQGHRVRF